MDQHYLALYEKLWISNTQISHLISEIEHRVFWFTYDTSDKVPREVQAAINDLRESERRLSDAILKQHEEAHEKQRI